MKRSSERVNYDEVAPTYDQRYAANALKGVASALRSLTQQAGAERILEVGCGTGHWLGVLQPLGGRIYGLDLSPGMLQQARQREKSFNLICGQASQLPLPNRVFDFIFCVNAFHHFDQPRCFLSEAHRLLRPGGALAIVGMEPPRARELWYIYQYFDETYEIDLRRFPSSATILNWMTAAGFARAEWRVAERIVNHKVGREVWRDPFLKKHSTSQLALLTDKAYFAGLDRIKAALQEAEAQRETLIFPVDISLTIVTGRLQEGGKDISRSKKFG